MFLISTFVPSSVAPGRRTDTLASQRSDPASMFPSQTPRYRRMVRRLRRYSAASAGDRRSGRETISMSGTPARL